MSTRTSKYLEYAVVAVLIAGTAWLGQLTYHIYVTHSHVVSARDVAPVTIPVTDLDGAHTSLTVQGRQRGLMLFVLSTECPYCEKNMPEWAQLARDVRAGGPGSPDVFALSVSPANETRRFLADHRLEVPVKLVDRSVLRLLGLTGYPTTITVRAADRAMTSWAGVLGEEDHRVLMAWADSSRATANATLTAAVSPPDD